jgi:17beta-estradiol 17-dehydrogenase / very-long-chain 3-oxoacyl-CoA reductase
MFVATKLAKIKRASLFVPSPSAYARSAVAAIGYESLLSPFWSHAVQIWLLTNLPESLVTAVTKSMHLGIRTAGRAE